MAIGEGSLDIPRGKEGREGKGRAGKWNGIFSGCLDLREGVNGGMGGWGNE